MKNIGNKKKGGVQIMEKHTQLIQESENEVNFQIQKDFYRGAQGEFRFKAEGLFKKAKEKKIAIEDIEVITLKENSVTIPGIGVVELPTFIAKVTGKLIKTGQVMTDGKQIDYYNQYQKYMAKKIEEKNKTKEDKNQPDFYLADWERFEIGKELIEDKEFGLEKTITGACDRVIRKLMGENDWLYPQEAAMLEEEFEEVQEKIRQTQLPARKASDKQISYFKSKLKNAGLDTQQHRVIDFTMEEMGFCGKKVEELSVKEMSQAIDKVYQIVPKVKERLNQIVQ